MSLNNEKKPKTKPKGYLKIDRLPEPNCESRSSRIFHHNRHTGGSSHSLRILHNRVKCGRHANWLRICRMVRRNMEQKKKKKKKSVDEPSTDPEKHTESTIEERKMMTSE